MAGLNVGARLRTVTFKCARSTCDNKIVRWEQRISKGSPLIRDRRLPKSHLHSAFLCRNRLLRAAAETARRDVKRPVLARGWRNVPQAYRPSVLKIFVSPARHYVCYTISWQPRSLYCFARPYLASLDATHSFTPGGAGVSFCYVFLAPGWRGPRWPGLHGQLYLECPKSGACGVDGPIDGPQVGRSFAHLMANHAAVSSGPPIGGRCLNRPDLDVCNGIRGRSVKRLLRFFGWSFLYR